MTIAHLLKRAGFDEEVAEVIGREGKIGVTTDLASDRRGGATQAGVSQAYFGKNPDGSWKRSKAQIAAMTPGEIKAVYRDIYKVPDKFVDPRVRKVMFDMTTNAGPTANGILQRSVNSLLPVDQHLRVDNIAGSGTLAAAKGVDQGRLAGKLLDGYSAHHTQLIKERPDLYAENKNGWRNRVSGLRSTIGAIKPVLVKGTPQPQPVLVKGQLQTPAPSAPAPSITQPGGPIRSMPMLSAPSTQVLSKQATRPISERMLRLRDRRGECYTCGKPNREGLVCDCGETKEWTKEASVASLLRQARNATHKHPTDAQRAAGNYRHGKVTIHGLRISIENPKSSVRKGKDKNGKAWANKLAGDYGFFAGTKAIDDDAIDVFIGDNLDSELVTVIDQYFDGKFDESKFVICSATQAKAEKIYLDSYQKGWKLGDVSTTTVQQLKEWLKDGDHKKPFKGQLVKAASVASLFRAAIAARSGTLRRVAC